MIVLTRHILAPPRCGGAFHSLSCLPRRSKANFAGICHTANAVPFTPAPPFPKKSLSRQIFFGALYQREVSSECETEGVVSHKNTAPRANLRGAPHLISFFSKNRVNDCNLSYIDTFVCVP